MKILIAALLIGLSGCNPYYIQDGDAVELIQKCEEWPTDPIAIKVCLKYGPLRIIKK